MGANSIRSQLTRDDIISEIRLFRSADSAHEYTHIILEGPDDVRFMQNNVSDKVNLYESFHGKTGVLDIVSSFNLPEIIGICDSDYDSREAPNHIFFYDNSTLETSLIGNWKTFRKVCPQLLSPRVAQDATIEDIYIRTFNNIRFISSMRKINAQEHLGLSFQSIRIAKAYNLQNKTLCKEEVLKQFVDANHDFSMQREKYRAFLKSVELEGQAEKKIENVISETQGHDCLEMLHCLCKPLKGRDKFNETSILAMFIVAYEFSNSLLYTSLLAYEQQNGLHITI